MANLSEFHRTESEALHKALYQIHRDIYFQAGKRIKDALMLLHKLEGDSMDIRAQCRGYIGEFEAIRAQLEAVGRNATNLRTKLIQENGCDGTCQGD